MIVTAVFTYNAGDAIYFDDELRIDGWEIPFTDVLNEIYLSQDVIEDVVKLRFGKEIDIQSFPESLYDLKDIKGWRIVK